MNAAAVNKQTIGIRSAGLAFDLASIGLAAMGNIMLAARLQLVPIALGLVLAACALRLVQHGTKIVSLPLHLPFLLFLVSAWIGVTVSYDPSLSLRKFELILGGVGLYYVLATTTTEFAKRAVVWGLVAIGTGAAVFFVTQTDFAQEPIKLGVLNEIGLLLNRVTPQLGQHTPHANLMAGIMLLALPYAICLTYDAWHSKRSISLLVGTGLGLLMAFGLVMTTSRGALLAFALLCSLATLFYLAGRVAKRAGYSTGLGIALVVNIGLILLLLGVLFARPQIGAVLNAMLGNVGGVSRLELYRQVVQLGSDYAVTGAGLDTFSPHYSTYELLINVPFLPHAHNLLLQVWFEQGLLGLIAFVWLIVGYFIWIIRRRARLNWLAIASAAAFTMLLLHGLVDVVLYFSRVISLMFIPLGLAVCALEPFLPLEKSESANPRRAWVAGGVGATVLLVLAAGIVVTRREQLTATWLANQGALAQARIELPLINFPIPTPGQVRRAEDLSATNDLFVKALRADPNNLTAHLRLGLVALDRADFPLALGHLQAAFAADPTNRAAVKALGYALVWSGQMDKAVPLLKQIPEAESELGYAAYDWSQRGRGDLSELASRMIRQLRR